MARRKSAFSPTTGSWGWLNPQSHRPSNYAPRKGFSSSEKTHLIDARSNVRPLEAHRTLQVGGRHFKRNALPSDNCNRYKLPVHRSLGERLVAEFWNGSLVSCTCNYVVSKVYITSRRKWSGEFELTKEIGVLACTDLLYQGPKPT
jgi:hypothetical protein